jgi:hypothetical protein
MPFLTAPVPGAQPVAVAVDGAQLAIPKGAGVIPGVVFVCVGVIVPGTGAVVTPVVPVGEFTVGVVVG